MRRESMLDLKRPEPPTDEPAPQPPVPDGDAYTDEEEAEVQKRLEDLGYI
jgi:hypothetical protein